MPVQVLSTTWTGTTPLLTHNARLVNPMDPITRAMKAITAKKKKTEDDSLELIRIEWAGGLFHPDAEAFVFGTKTNGGKPYITAPMVHACIREGATRSKRGKDVNRGMQILDDKIELVYQGPTGIKEMWATGKFTDVRPARIGQKRVMRCRPIFRQWAVTFEMHIDDTVLSIDELRGIVQDAGRFAGIGDHRPLFGRFDPQF